MNELNIYKQTAKMVAFTILSIALCRFTQSVFAPFFVLLGVWCAFADKLGWALVFYVLMPFFIILNPGILPKESPLLAYSMRMGPLLIGLVLAFRASGRRGHHRLPLFGLIPFLLVACVSSAGGWAPRISYLKLINFFVFLLGLWYGTQNLQYRPKDVFLLRSFFLAMATIIVAGSIMTIAVPSIGYATSLSYALREGGTELAEEVFREQRADSMLTLFCGVTNHSQCLAPMSCCVLGWCLCDMLFIEQRFRWPHVMLVLGCLPLLYMTRSRTALFASAFTLLIISLYTVRKGRLSLEVRQRLNKGIVLFGCVLFVFVLIAQLRSGMMTKWIRKYGDESQNTLSESLMVSRRGLMEQSMMEFKRNPLLGSGFQVAWYTQDRESVRKGGFVISASVEKGVWPVMILGETGILGEAVFLAFLFTFFSTCSRREYYVTATMFAVFLMTNMAEATLFSPGGGGGIMWMFCIVGGFTIDTIMLYRKNLEQQWGQMAAMAQMRQMQEVERRRRLGLD